MTVTINIVGDSAVEVLDQLQSLAGSLLTTRTLPAPLVVEEATTKKPRGRSAKKADEPVPAPAPEPAEVQAQDAADEAAESEEQEEVKAEAPAPAEEAPKPVKYVEVAEEPEPEPKGPKPLTHEDVRAAFGAYGEKYGMDAVQQDGKKLMQMALKDDTVKTIKDIPNTQAALSAVVEGAKEMLEKNPFKRKPLVQDNSDIMG